MPETPLHVQNTNQIHSFLHWAFGSIVYMVETAPPSPRSVSIWQKTRCGYLYSQHSSSCVTSPVPPQLSPRRRWSAIPRHPRAARGVYKSSVTLRDTCATESPNWFGHARCQWISATTLTILNGSRSHVERAPPKMANCMGGKEGGRVIIVSRCFSVCCVWHCID